MDALLKEYSGRMVRWRAFSRKFVSSIISISLNPFIKIISLVQPSFLEEGLIYGISIL